MKLNNESIMNVIKNVSHRKDEDIDTLLENFVDVFEEFIESKGYSKCDFPNPERDRDDAALSPTEMDIRVERCVYGEERENMKQNLKELLAMFLDPDEKILPCPFCGETPKLERNKIYFSIECKNENCMMQPETGWLTSKPEILKTWNTRSDKM